MSNQVQQIALQFHKGLIVFAKCENCQPWPAKIIKIEYYQFERKNYFTVLFYNDKSISVLKEQNLEPFNEQTIKEHRKSCLQQGNSQSKKLLKAISMAEIAFTKENYTLKKQESGKIKKGDKPKKRLMKKQNRNRKIQSSQEEDNQSYPSEKQMNSSNYTNKSKQLSLKQVEKQHNKINSEQVIKEISNYNIDRYLIEQQANKNIPNINSNNANENTNKSQQNRVNSKYESVILVQQKQEQPKKQIFFSDQDNESPRKNNQIELEHKKAESEITEAEVQIQPEVVCSNIVEEKQLQKNQVIGEKKEENYISEIQTFDKSYRQLLLNLPNAMKQFNHLTQYQIERHISSYFELMTNYLQKNIQSILSFSQKTKFFALMRLITNFENKSQLIADMVEFVLEFEREKYDKKQYYSVEYLIIREKLQGLCAFRDQFNFDNNIKQILINYVQRKGINI